MNACLPNPERQNESYVMSPFFFAITRCLIGCIDDARPAHLPSPAQACKCGGDVSGEVEECPGLSIRLDPRLYGYPRL